MSLLSIDRELARNSYYAATAPRMESFPALNDAVTADVAIVGSGLAGLSAAIELAEHGLSVVLLEAGQVGGGASGRNGGQALAGLACDQATIEAQLGLDEAKRIWVMSLEAIQLIRRRSEQFGIDCEWQSGYLSLATNARKARELQAGVEAMAQKYGFQQRWIAGNELPDWISSPRFAAGCFDGESGHLHPLKYCLGLSQAAKNLGVRIFEHSAVTKLVHGQQVRLSTAQGSVRAGQVLLAGNVYLQEIAPDLAPTLCQRIMPVGTYIACTEPLDAARLKALIPSRAAVCDTNFALDYFRPTADQRLLYGGRVSYSTATPRDLKQSMQQRLLATFPQLQGVSMDYAWGGFVDISMNRAPDFGRLGPNANVYYLQGFSGHGLALTGLAGRVVAEAMQGDAGRFDCFAKLRHRPFPGGKLMRTPALVLGMAYYRLRDMF
ncbi:NAD(P)/FAD-dependent oxidoreductase [Roseateles oligotrophus]|uniref:FAD-binding oxidoreductase n=1 Tax=Roseateles oligotrophus TaxID=1769250 RepID=A0ABT2YMG9_9BURK|nr:FAD-binding oxidoreductase [Roseateles oligotrophus]MCV2371268.1 FAD-binding oxidoreductase [Roseateles oligotrophus]